MFGLLRRKSSIKREHSPWHLDAPVLRLPNGEAITWRRALSGVFIAGITGSGKSTSSAKHMARAMVRLGAGGLVVSVKNERRMWEKLLQEENRLDDLVVFDAQSQWRFDPIAHEASRKGPGGGVSETVVEMLMTLVELSSRGGDPGGRDNEAYWRNSCKELIRNAADALILANWSVTALHIYQMVISAPHSRAQIQTDEQWKQASFCLRCLAEADKRPKSPRQKADFGLVADYFLVRFAGLNDRTRSVVVSQFTSTCDSLLRGTMRELFCGESNITPEAVEEGKIILVDLCLKEWGILGLQANLLWKTAFQRSIERRDLTRNQRPVFLWQDEGHYLLTRDDVLFQSTCRSSLCASILITQNIPNLDVALGTGDAGRAEAESLLANFGTLVFHGNTCQRTNEFASGLIGRKRELMASGNINYSTEDEWSASLGLDSRAGNSSAGFSEQYQPIFEPAAFSRLRCGGPAHGWQADAVVIQCGEVFRSTGATWTLATFDQDL